MPALPWQRQGFRLLQMACVKRALLPPRDSSDRLPRKDDRLLGMCGLGYAGRAEAQCRRIVHDRACWIRPCLLAAADFRRSHTLQAEGRRAMLTQGWSESCEIS